MADNYMQKKCDFCGEAIPVNAGRCAYCGSILEVVHYDDYRNDAQIPQPEDAASTQGSAEQQYTTESRNTVEQQGTTQTQNPQEQYTAQSQNTGEQQSGVEQQNTGEQQSGVERQDAGEQNYGSEPQGYMEPQSPESEDGSQKAPPVEEHRPSAEYYGQAPYNARNTHYNAERPYYKASYTDDLRGDKEPLSNGLKVLLTVLFTILPGIGQLAGIITAIVFMNAEDKDRKSFGVALLVACLVMFVLACIGCFVLGLASQSIRDYW